MSFLLTAGMILLAGQTGQSSGRPPDSTMWQLRAGSLDPGAVSLDRLQTRMFLSNLLDLSWSDPLLLEAAASLTSGAGSASRSPVAILVSAGTSDGEKVQALREQLVGGSTDALVPLACLLVELGRTEEAAAYMEGMGVDIPATRYDLAVAAAWYGRFDVYPLMVEDLEVPPDVEGDSRESQIAAMIALGWLEPAPDGLFHGTGMLWRPVLQRFAEAFSPGVSPRVSRVWVSLREMEAYFLQAVSGGPGLGTGTP